MSNDLFVTLQQKIEKAMVWGILQDDIIPCRFLFFIGSGRNLTPQSVEKAQAVCLPP